MTVLKQKVKDLMTTNIIATLPSDTIEEAAILMKENNIGSVPVVSAGELKGILTDRDIVTRCVAESKKPDSTKVSELMSSDIAFVTPEQSIHDAISIMSNEQVRRLPVIKDGYIDGMISFADIARNNTDMEIAKAISEISEPGTNFSNATKTI